MRRGVEAILLDGSVLLRKYDPPPTNWQSAAAVRKRHSPAQMRQERSSQVCPKTGAYILVDRITHYYYY